MPATKRKPKPRKRAKAEPKVVWLSRSDSGPKAFYVLWSKLPTQDDEGYYYGGFGLYQMCARKFEAVTDYRLKPGDCRKVRIPIIPCDVPPSAQAKLDRVNKAIAELYAALKGK